MEVSCVFFFFQNCPLFGSRGKVFKKGSLGLYKTSSSSLSYSFSLGQERLPELYEPLLRLQHRLQIFDYLALKVP